MKTQTFKIQTKTYGAGDSEDSDEGFVSYDDDFTKTLEKEVANQSEEGKAPEKSV